MKPLILIIEDDRQIRRFLRATLVAEGYVYQEALTAHDGILQANTRRPDLILLDLGLPDRDGLEVIRSVRESSQVPILILSARGQEKDKVTALDLGADDYIAKPFGVLELLARIRVALRRPVPRSQDDELIRFGRVEIDLDGRIVKVDGQTIHLTRNEYKLLYVLSKHAGKVLTQQQLLNEIWGPNHLAQAQYLRVYIAHLRRKLEADPARPQHLQTESGVGYRLVID